MSSTGPSSPNDPVLRFGVFEVDLAAAELRKRGQRVKLEAQPFQVLTILAGRPGELVTRDELQKALWSEDTFVEFDHSLNTAVKKIRQALGDSPKAPRYIETAPRQGYRFIAAVQSLGEDRAGGERVEQVRARRFWVTGAVAAAVVGLIGWIAWSSPGWSENSSTVFNPVPLTAYPGRESSPSFSPDGSQVAFSWNGEQEDNYDIYVKLIDSGMPDRLTTDLGDDIGPVWSPDGNHIAFFRRTPSGTAIYLVSSRGRSERKLADVTGFSPWTFRLTWSADSSWLAFPDAPPSGGYKRIFVISVATLEKRTLPIESEEVFDYWCPVFSPDGQTIAFVGSSEDAFRGDIYLAPAAGGTARRLTFLNQHIHGLAWTPDSRDIVLSLGVSYRDGVLQRVPATGGDPEPLSELGENVVFPDISRRGDRMVYTRRNLETNIWRFSSRGGGTAEKFIASTRRDEGPAYSPDGQRILFHSDRSGAWQLWQCDRDGRDPKPLTATEGLFKSWSPDGKEIAIECRPEANWDVCLISAGGVAQRALTTYHGTDTRPSWSKDGKWIYFASDRTGTFQVWKVPSGGGLPGQVTRRGGWNPIESPDGRWLYYSKEGNIWRMPVEGGEETVVLDNYARAIWGNWTPVSDGLYFVDWEGNKGSLKFLHRESGRVDCIATDIPVEKRAWSYRLAVSPDRKWLLFPQLDRIDEDLILVEDFR